jgi:hypothetical protein
MQPKPLLVLLLSLVLFRCARAQDSSSLYNKVFSAPDKLFSALNKKTNDFNDKLVKQTNRYLIRLAKKEQRLKEKLWRTDSVKAKEIFGDPQQTYSALQSKLKDGTGKLDKFSNVYNGHLDSMTTALKFLEQNKLLGQSSATQARYKQTLEQYARLQGKLNGIDAIEKTLQQRQTYLKEQLQQLAFTKQFRKYQKDLYYYKAQVTEYKKAFDDPEAIEQKALSLLREVPAFKNFFARYSELGGLFRLPGRDADIGSTPIAGLQTRDMLQQDMLQRFGSTQAVQRAAQQGMGEAQAQLKQLKDKVNQLGNKGGDISNPDFKPNDQKTRSFWNRLEYGSNFQTAQSTYFFPTTTDLGLSVGYKLNDKSTIGIGASYKMGWGKDIRHISITHEGVGLRSFLDMKLKGSFYASGGFEYNYQPLMLTASSSTSIPPTAVAEASAWKQSGLLGLSKIISMQSKFFKKTKVQLLWDFLSYQQLPRTQPVKLRVGYNF